MLIHVESTSRLAEVVMDGAAVPARIWEGRTEAGVPVICWVTRIAVKRDADTRQFEAELVEQRAPSAEAQAFPLRMIL
jgi:hypothetical protein